MEQIKFADIWNTLSKIDCSGHTEKKKTGRDTELTYLSWTWAWTELMKRYPEATYTIREWDGKPWLNDPVAGVLVMTEVNIGGNVRQMWLPAMDGANNALKEAPYTYTVKGFNGNPIEKKVAAVDMMAINKAIMRCLVKNLAMFGLGLNIYAGEDLPVGIDEEDKKTPAPAQEQKKTPAKKATPAKGKEAWAAFKALKGVDKMDERSRTAYWSSILKEAAGKASSSECVDEDWDKIINHISVIAAM